MFSIGEFSRATALTVKTLRHYHERGLLIPSRIDPSSGYRYYDRTCLERAGVIKALRELEFSLEDVAQILASCEDDADALEFLERQRSQIATRLAHLESIQNSLEHVIQTQTEARAIMQQDTQIEHKTIHPLLVAGVRMRGRFDQAKVGFKQLGRAFGFGLAGKPGMLIYDAEYKPEDADFEVFFPIKRAKPAGEAIAVRELAGGRCLSLIHRGPYDQISTVYARLFTRAQELGLKTVTPSREIYIKGPGMLFAGNPDRYLTEVQIFVDG